MNKNYDIIIVGAGVSGLMLAKLLDNSGLKVLVLEKKRKISIEPTKFGTFTKTAKEHKLEKYIEEYFDVWAFYGPNVKASQTQKKIMCLVNYHKWAGGLKLINVLVKTNINLKKARRVGGGILLIDGKHSYFGKLVVDASGYAQVVHRLLGLETHKQTGLSYEVELSNCHLPIKNEASFILNFNVSNSGGWLYVLSKERVQFGWADFYPDSASNILSLKKRTLRAINEVSPHNEWLKKGRIKYSYGRFGPTGCARHKISDNLISIGDAGGFGTPVTLEGFRLALDSAEMAYVAVLKAKQYTKAELQLFLDLFYQKHGRYYQLHKIVRYVYLHWTRNEDLDRWVVNFQKLSKADFFKLIRGELTAALMLKTLDLVLVKNIMLNALNNILPKFLRFRPSISLSRKEVINEKS